MSGQLAYVAAAYGLTSAGTLAVTGWSWWTMRVAERRADEVRRK